jgi:excisionase family DNA binding protein
MTTSDPDSLFVSVGEAAKLLGICEALVWRLIRRGEIPARKFGNRRVIARRWITEQADVYSDDQPPAVVRLPRRKTGS